MNIQTLPNPTEIEAVLGIDGRGRRRRWLRRLIWLLVLAAAIGAAAWYLLRPQAAESLVYETKSAARANLTIIVTATGKIQPTVQVDVSSEMSGIVKSVAADNNETVKAGQALAELDLDRSLAQRDRAKAQLSVAEAGLADARATMAEKQLTLSRQETLRKKGLATAQDWEAAQAAQLRAAAAIAQAEANIEVAKADLKVAQTDIDKSKIVAPIDGMVLKRAVEPGQTVASSLQAPILFTIAGDLKYMQVEADVDEADIGVVQVGQDAKFTVDAFPGRKFPATIKEIRYAPQNTDGVVTYKAILSVANEDLSLRPGMTATAEINVKSIIDALAIPNAALRYAPPKAPDNTGFSLTRLFMPRFPRFEKPAKPAAEDGKMTVYVLKDGKPVAASIETGDNDGKLTAVVSGDLKEGDAVILSSRKGGQ
jgi:HlyD family secretion protein